MATKKQRRERALAKREAFLEERRISGMAAIKADQRDRVKRKQAKALEQNRKKNAAATKKIAGAKKEDNG